MTAPPPSGVLGRRVREHRELHGLTQSDLAQRLTEGLDWQIDRTMIARIESADRQVNVDEMFKLAAALETTPALLLTPADEKELMLPTPWRPMTSNRVRAWIGDSVPLWEQDRAAYQRSNAGAWVLTDRMNEEMTRLLKRIALLHGVESVQEITEATAISDRDQAEVDLIDLRLELTMRRHEWETRVGDWEFTDVASLLDRLDQSPVEAASAATALWGHPPLLEIQSRQEESRPDAITTVQQSADRISDLIGALIAVVEDLAGAVAHAPRTMPAIKRAAPTPRLLDDRA